MKQLILRGAVAALTVLTLAAPAAARIDRPAASLAGPAIFKSGFNKCRVATLAAMAAAGNARLTAARFDGKTCNWSSADGAFTIVVDTHPAGYLELLGPSIGKHPNGDVARVVAVPGASKAVLETFSHANTGRYAKDLLAVYSQGVVQVSMNYTAPLLDRVVVAVLRLVTHA